MSPEVAAACSFTACRSRLKALSAAPVRLGVEELLAQRRTARVRKGGGEARTAEGAVRTARKPSIVAKLFVLQGVVWYVKRDVVVVRE